MEYRSCMLDMALRRLGKYNDIFQVYKTVLSADRWQHYVYHALKSNWRVLEIERHSYKLLQSMVSAKRYVLYVLFVNFNLQNATASIQCRETWLSPSESLLSFITGWGRNLSLWRTSTADTVSQSLVSHPSRVQILQMMSVPFERVPSLFSSTVYRDLPFPVLEPLVLRGIGLYVLVNCLLVLARFHERQCLLLQGSH